MKNARTKYQALVADWPGVTNAPARLTNAPPYWSGKLDVWGSVGTTNAPWSVLVDGEASRQFNGTTYRTQGNTPCRSGSVPYVK